MYAHLNKTGFFERTLMLMIFYAKVYADGADDLVLVNKHLRSVISTCGFSYHSSSGTRYGSRRLPFRF